MNTVRVAAAMLIRGGKVFAAQRGCGAFKGLWEFPGGKIEEGETPAAALERELKEELGITVSTNGEEFLAEYDYPDFHLAMHCFSVYLHGEIPVISEHSDFRWLGADELESVSWLPAEYTLLPRLKELLRK